MKKLAIITTHPIQYYAPLFRLMSMRGNIDLKVFYTLGDTGMDKYDVDFNQNINWDIPLLSGYNYEWVDNTAPNPGSHYFNGIVNPGLIGQIKSYNPDALLVFGWAYNSHLKVIRYFKNKLPVYFRGDSTLLDTKKNLRSVFKTVFLKWVYRHIDHAFYVGTNNKAYFKKYGLTEHQLTFAPHAVDNERFALSKKDEAKNLREGLGIPAEDMVILFAGKLQEKKSPQLLLNAFSSLNKPNVHLLFVGDGFLKESLKLQADTQNNIHFINFTNQANMPVMYQACDIFCLPSKGPNETWGLAVNEAMACGKAVLVSDKCGCAIDLVTEKNGVIFESENIEEITAGLKKLTANRETLIELGRQSMLIIKNRDFLHIAAAIENKLLNETGR